MLEKEKVVAGGVESVALSFIGDSQASSGIIPRTYIYAYISPCMMIQRAEYYILYIYIYIFN